LHQVGDVFELNVKLRCQNVKRVSEIQHYVLQVQLTIRDRCTALDKNNVTRYKHFVSL